MSARHYARVYGPNIQGPFDNSETLSIESANDLKTPADGSLVIKMAAQEAGISPRGNVIRARKPRVVIYPRGEWYKVVVGEIEPHTKEPEATPHGP